MTDLGLRRGKKRVGVDVRCHTYIKFKQLQWPSKRKRLACQRYLVAADDSWGEQRLLGANNLLSLLELCSQRFHLLLLLLLLNQQLLMLPAGGRQSLLRHTQIEGEKVLAVEEPLHRELSKAQELQQSWVHGGLAPLASLPLQATEGHHADVLLKGIHVQLAHY